MQQSAPADARLEWIGPVSDAQRSAAALLRSARSPDAQPANLPAALAAQGLPVLPALFDILGQERLPRVHPDDAAQLLNDAQRQLLLAALAKFPPAAVRAELDRRLPGKSIPEDPQLCVMALRVFAVIGTRADLVALAGCAPRKDGEIANAGCEPLRAAYAAILRREPQLLPQTVQLLQSTDASAAKQLLFALGDLGDKRALAVFETCARSYPALAQQAVALVPRIGASGDPDLDHSFAAWMAQNLDPERTEWNRACLRAIGVLDDGTEVPLLLDSLRSPQQGLREAALGSLRQISALNLGAAPEAWREWFARESDWMTSGRRAAERSLRSKDPALIVEALGAYAGHRLFRDELAADILPLLEYPLPSVRLMACDSLARLGSKRALQLLVEHISDERAAVAQAAWQAACALSGQVLPHSTTDARELLAGI